MELNQLGLLIQMAMRSKSAAYFQWLDPTGDPNASLGAGFASSIQISQDKVDLLKLQKAQLEATIRQKARAAFDELQASLRRQQISKDALVRQEKRLARVLETVKFGKDSNSVELVNVYQDLLRARMENRTGAAAIQMAQVRIKRLLLEGYYSRLPFVLTSP